MPFRIAPVVRSALVGVLAAWGLGACAAPTFNGREFRSGEIAFRVGPVPDQWRLVDSQQTDSDLASFAFRDDAAHATIAAAGRCGRDGDDVPLRALTQHLTIGFTQRAVQAEEPLSLGGRAALRTEMTAELDGVKKYLVLVVIKKDLCVYDFWRIADSPDSDSAEFDGFVAGFQTLR